MHLLSGTTGLLIRRYSTVENDLIVYSWMYQCLKCLDCLFGLLLNGEQGEMEKKLVVKLSVVPQRPSRLRLVS